MLVNPVNAAPYENVGSNMLVIGSTDCNNCAKPTTGTPHINEDLEEADYISNVAGGLFINNSNQLVLLGNATRVDLADGPVWVAGLANDSTMNARLVLGSSASATATKGHLAKVYVGLTPQGGQDLEGELHVLNGEFAIDTLGNSRDVYVGSATDHDALLNVGEMELSIVAKVVNNAKLNITTLKTREDSGSVSMLNRGEMTFGSADLNGDLENYSKVTANSLILRDSGSKNHAGASLVVTDFTIAGETAYGNDGVNHGKLLNEGTLEVTNTMTVEGTFTNDGQAKAEDFTLAANAVVENRENGVLTTNNAVINGAVTNVGEYVIDGMGASLAAGGSIVNKGTITGNAKLTVAGGTLDNQATANLTGLEITSGAVTNAQGATITDSGKTTIAMDNTSDVAIVNQGVLNFADLDLQSGTIAGGTVNATNAVIDTGGVIDNIVGDFGTLANSGAVNFNAGNVSALTNNASGTINANGVVSLAGQNNGLISVKPDGQLVVNAGMTLTNTNMLEAMGQTSVSGTLDNAGTATFTGDVTIADGGRLNNTQKLSGSKVTIADGGTLASAGNTVIAELLAQTGSTIEVNGALTSVGNLVADDVTYNQTGGTIAAYKGWFTNSVLNIMGGTLDASTIKDEAGNITGMLGNNTVNIGNGTTSMPSDPSGESWKDGLAVVTVDTLTSDTQVNVKQGGVLDVNTLNLTGDKTLVLAGGGLQTSMDQIFGGLKTEAIKIDATDPDSGTVQLPSSVLGVTHVGDVHQFIQTGADFQSGLVAFDDQYLSVDGLAAATTKFGEAFTGTQVDLHFLGTLTDKFTIDTARDLLTNGIGSIVLDTTTLHNTTSAGDANRKLIIGDRTEAGANSINASFGFKNVANADRIDIHDDKEFVLVGYEKPEGFDWKTGYDDSNKLLVDATDGGMVQAENGTLTMGSDGLSHATVGWVKTVEVNNESIFNVKNGEFKVTTLTLNNNASTKINANGVLHVDYLNGNNTAQVTNDGYLTVKKLQVVGSVINNGSLLLTSSNTLIGEFKNNGLLTAENLVKVGGELTTSQTGHSIFTVLNVQGKVNNAGIEEGNELDVAGKHINTGSSIWNEVVVKGELQNNATEEGKGMQIGNADQAGTLQVLSGKFENNGLLDASHADALIEGEQTFMVNGEAGTVIGKTLTLNGGNYHNMGTSQWDKLVLDSGFLHAKDGVFAIESAELNGGDITVGNDLALSEDNKASLVIMGDTTVNSSVAVIGNGNLAFGSDKDFGPSLGLEDLPAHPSRVTVGKTVTIGATGSLVVGEPGSSVVDNGNMLFKGDSTTIVDIGSLGNAPAFATTVEGATATIEDGAQLVLGNVSQAGDYQITEGFDLSGNLVDGVWTGGWDNVSMLPQNGSGLGWDLVFNQNDAGIFVTATLDNVETLYPNIAMGRMVNAYMKMADSTLADVRFVNSVLTDEHHGIEEKTQVINTITEMGLASSSLALAVNDVTVVTNAVEQRASLMSDAWTGKGNGLWADILHSQQEVDGYKASGLSVGYDASSTGFVMGYDHRLANNTTLVGGAMSYQKGDSDSTGKVAKTNNDYSTFGVHGYVAYNPNPAFNLVGSVSYLRNAAEATANLGFGDIKKAEADIDTDIFTAGVRAESAMKLTESVKVVPHAGIRVVHAKGSSYTTKLDGERGFKSETDASTLVQFPVGVAVRMDKTMDNGWTMRPNADVTLVAQAGDTDQSIDVTGTTGITETVDGDFTGSFNTQVSFGLEAQKDNTTVGFRYGATMGGDGKRDHQLKAEVRFAF